MAGDCGTCTLCCKVLGIAELKKPTNTWCSHCKPGQGCGIYATRPPSCRLYACLWLQGAEAGQDPPIKFRPDHSKVVFTNTTSEGVIAAHVDPGYPKAAETDAIKQFIAKLVLSLGVRVIVGVGSGNRKLLYVRGGGDTVTRRYVTMSAPDEQGMQYYLPEAQDHVAQESQLV